MQVELPSLKQRVPQGWLAVHDKLQNMCQCKTPQQKTTYDQVSLACPVPLKARAPAAQPRPGWREQAHQPIPFGSIARTICGFGDQSCSEVLRLKA